MTRTQLLQELRQMRFQEAYGDGGPVSGSPTT